MYQRSVGWNAYAPVSFNQMDYLLRERHRSIFGNRPVPILKGVLHFHCCLIVLEVIAPIAVVLEKPITFKYADLSYRSYYLL